MSKSLTTRVRPHRLANGKHGGWRKDRPKYGEDYKIEDLLGPAKRGAIKNPCLDPQYFPWIKDQGNLGSCTGNSVATAVEYCILKVKDEAGEDITSKWWLQWGLSALAAYWLGRRAEASINEDSGCEIRDVVDAVREFGIPTEKSWPYRISKFKQTPSPEAMKTSPWHKAGIKTYRCDGAGGSREATVTNIVRAIEAGHPVNYGFACPADWGNYDSTGVVPMPNNKFDGGHAIDGFQVDTDAKILWGPNSWSNEIGGPIPQAHLTRYPDQTKGWIGLPLQYFLDGNADDGWAIVIT